MLIQLFLFLISFTPLSPVPIYVNQNDLASLSTKKLDEVNEEEEEEDDDEATTPTPNRNQDIVAITTAASHNELLEEQVGRGTNDHVLKCPQICP